MHYLIQAWLSVAARLTSRQIVKIIIILNLHMLSNLIQAYTSRLTLQLSQSIVIRYQKKRSVFDKTTYNPDWIPRVRQFSKHRKPSMTEWTDPDVILPQYIPPLHKKTNFAEYIKNTVEKQQMIKAERKKQYLLDDIRPGDMVQITYQETFESQSTTSYKALVLSFKRRKSLTAGLEVLLRLGGMNMKAMFLIHSPKVKNIKVVGEGSGNLRNNLKHGWKTMKRMEATKPRIRNNVLKPRGGVVRQARMKHKGTNIKFDKVESDIIKRIVQ